MKIAIVVSHPIQHFCPMYASWAKIDGIELKVFFGSQLGAAKYVDPSFGKEIAWSNLYLDEFEHEFLNGNNAIQPTSQLDAPNLGEKLDEFAPQLLIHYGYFHKLAKRAKKWAIKNRVKIGYISDAERRRHRPFWKEVVKYPYLYFYFKSENYFFTVGNANEDYYRFYGVPKVKMHRMMFSIDIQLYDKAYKSIDSLYTNTRQKYGIGKNDIVISTVGKLLDFKSQNHLIQVLNLLEKKMPKKIFHVLIAGSGPAEEDWKKEAAILTTNKVCFLGFVNPTDLPGIYAASDIYIHTSMYDAHSLSISEAIYMGCPVITTDKTGSWGSYDDVQENVNGYVYAYGNIEQLANQISTIILENKFKEFGQNSLKISREFQQFSHYRVIETIKRQFS
jgi:glycosyltransferase involved in cell wall biosynthesis